MFGLSKNDMNPISDSTYVQPTYLPTCLAMLEGEVYYDTSTYTRTKAT